jgi:hypothetical protein
VKNLLIHFFFFSTPPPPPPPPRRMRIRMRIIVKLKDISVKMD